MTDYHVHSSGDLYVLSRLNLQFDRSLFIYLPVLLLSAIDYNGKSWFSLLASEGTGRYSFCPNSVRLAVQHAPRSKGLRL